MSEESKDTEIGDGSKVEDPKPEAKKAPAKKKAKPKKNFPQNSIEESKKILDVIKDFNAGNPWSPTEVAKALVWGKAITFSI